MKDSVLTEFSCGFSIKSACARGWCGVCGCAGDLCVGG